MMISVLTALALTLAIFVAIMIAYSMRRRAYLARQAKGLSLLKECRILLTLVQQHRGLTNGYLKGDKALMGQIHPIQAQVSRSMERLNQELWFIDSVEWKDIEQRWSVIVDQHQSMSPDQSLRRHSAMIACLLFLIDDCAEYFRLYEIVHEERGSIRYLWQDILVTAENIGQARAIGTGVAAAKTCSSVDRIRLNYLNQAIGKIEHLDGNPTLKTLKATIERQVLVESVDITPSDYFGLATSAIEVLLDTFDRTLEEAQKKLSVSPS